MNAKHWLGLFLLPWSCLFALPIGNPWDPSLYCQKVCFLSERLDQKSFLEQNAIAFRLGYFGDYVYERHLTVDADPRADIQSSQVMTNAAFIVINYCQRFDFCAAFGASNLDIRSSGSAFKLRPSNVNTFTDPVVTGIVLTSSANPTPNNRIAIQTETDFSWALDLKGILWKCRRFAVGGEVNYFFTNPQVNRVDLPSLSQNIGGDDPTNPGVAGVIAFQRAPSTLYPNSHIHCKYREFQLALSAAYLFCMTPTINVIPYAAIQWAHAQVDFGEARLSTTASFPPSTLLTPVSGIDLLSFLIDLSDLKQQRTLGYAMGLTFLGCERFTIGMEGRFASETAFNLNTQIRF